MSGLTKGARVGGALAQGWSSQAEDYPLALDWRADGRCLFVADAGGSVYCFDAHGGERLWFECAHAGGALALAAQPAGAALLTAGKDGRTIVWDGATGKILAQIPARQSWIEHLAWSPDGSCFAMAAGRDVGIWTRDGSQIGGELQHPNTVSAIKWTSGGQLVTACYGRVATWCPTTGALQDNFEWQGSLISLAVSRDGEIIACGSQDATVHFWRRSTGRDSEMRGYAGKPSTVVFDRQSRWLATNGGEDLTVWDFSGGGPEGSAPLILSLHTAAVTCARFAGKHDLLASGAQDASVCLWNMAGQQPGSVAGAALVNGRVEQLGWRPDDRGLAALDADGGITVWRVRPEQAIDSKTSLRR